MMNAMGSNHSAQGWKWGSSLGAVLVAASAWLSGSAWAAAASDLTVTLEDTQPDPVSLSKAGAPANIVYRIRMRNSGGNTINQVVFTGSTDVGAYSAFVNIGAINPNCAAPSSPVDLNVHSVFCQVGQLKADESVEFFLFFQTPTSGASITFNGHTDFSEGASSQQKPAHFTKDLDPPKVVALITADANKKAKTVFPDKGTLSTGGTPGLDNPFSTSVTVPSTKTTTFGKPTVTNNSIDESFAGATTQCALNSDGTAYFCYGLSSAIEVLDAVTGEKVYLTGPLAGPQITIVLTQDISSLTAKKPVPKIDDVRIFYTYLNPKWPAETPQFIQIELKKCSDTSPPGPFVNEPCVFDRINNVKGNKGNYQYIIHALDNGQFNY